VVRKVQVVKMDPSRFQVPIEIPKEIPAPIEDIPTISSLGVLGGVTGGVPGGVVGGVPGGMLGGVLGRVPSVAPPPPPPRGKKKPIRVGGNVQASKLIHRVEPRYPELAKKARVSALVLLQVTVGEDGNVADIKLLRGHPLLNKAALDAVRQWKYSPTLLNGEPVPVIATVTVNFVLR
jgi:protein TonB